MVNLLTNNVIQDIISNMSNILANKLDTDEIAKSRISRLRSIVAVMAHMMREMVPPLTMDPSVS